MTKLKILENQNKINDFGIMAIDYKITMMTEKTHQLELLKYKLEKTILDNNSIIDKIKQKKAYQNINDLWKLT